MNRKTFLAAIAGIITAPSILKAKKPDLPPSESITCQAPGGKIVGIYIPSEDLSYADFEKEWMHHDAKIMQEQLSKQILNEFSKTA
jgi:hypothetical protein